MNTIEIPAIGVCREIPSKWSEMTPEQARVTMRLLWDMESGLISPLEFHVRVLYLLLGIKRTWRSVMWENSIEPLPSRRMPTFFCFAKISSAGCLPTPRTVCSRHSTPYRIRCPKSISAAIVCVGRRRSARPDSRGISECPDRPRRILEHPATRGPRPDDRFPVSTAFEASQPGRPVYRPHPSRDL